MGQIHNTVTTQGTSVPFFIFEEDIFMNETLVLLRMCLKNHADIHALAFQLGVTIGVGAIGYFLLRKRIKDLEEQQSKFLVYGVAQVNK
jgi:hypothetical protein